MTAHARAMPQRRGACPGLSAPMPTGDGLLVRLMPIGTIPLDAFSALCAAARAHGNGVIEVTSRGSIQVRGLSAISSPRFAAAMADLGIAADDGIPIHCNALSGIDAGEIFDAGALAAELRRALADRSMADKVSAKVSVAIDGGGALDLAALAADIRLRAQRKDGNDVLRVGIGGDASNAADLGTIALTHGVEAVTRLLEALAARGRDVRARDVLANEGATVFRAAIADLLSEDTAPPMTRRSNDPIGLHRLRDGSFARSVALSFGHTDAAALERFLDAAREAGARGLRAAPGRILVAIGLTRQAADTFTAAAAQLGFIVRPDDPRRHVVACAGAPICASAHIASRALAPLVAEQAAAEGLDDAFTIHISGCAKSCARAAPAALTVVGTPEGCALIAHGSTRDTPFAVVPATELPAAIAKLTRAQQREAAHV